MRTDQPQIIERWRTRHTSGDQMRAEASYRRRVGMLKWLLPAAALALTSVIGWSWFNPSTTAFRIDYSIEDFELSGQDEMLNPRFFGTDSRNQRYTVTAESATRPLDGSEQVFLIKPTADITVAEGDWLTLNAEQGIYDRYAETLALSGAVSMYADNGFEMHTESAQFDLAGGTIKSDSPVRGQGPWGLLNAKTFAYARKGDVLLFSGRPTLVLYPAPIDTKP